ncbi:PIN domain-containing protein [Candidatus Marithrix sp. Canyon 246]|uniref:PIN domain-containing protein n=1 Tax=Candidatus Marithrix sp. Canyon 246 TaxID=1827136 RepID=UPI0009F2C943|nr:PIN domain-containing protein [Candidatus Marithrix sp. Canyon 246]
MFEEYKPPELEQSVSEATIPDKDTVLLIDIENCPTQIKQLQSNLITFSQVFICYAQNNCPKIPLDWLNTLAIAINENRLKIIKMKTATKNSADFGICFFSGMLMERLPKETHFIIVSNDSDLDHAIELLKSQGRSAERIGSVKKNNNTLSNINDDSLTTYCKYLIKHSKTKPAKKDSLMNSIKLQFKGMPHIAKNVFEELINKSIVDIMENGKVTYNLIKLKEFT